MATLQKEFNVMGLPMAISRNNPIPLDKTAVWYNEIEMRNYAKMDPTSYVGQILGLVDETGRNATAYIIINTSGDLKEVGAAIVVDNNTIVVNDSEALSLKDFEKSFYKYVPATETTEASYKKVNVGDLDDEGNAYTWLSGLEPKVVKEGDNFVLGWYEPNPTTMEGVSASIAALQNSINSINGEITALEQADTELSTGLQTAKNDINNRYTKAETDSKIAAAVAAAEHLKREVVTELPAVDDADVNTIYMIASGLQDDDNKYYEWMVINGAWEQIGSWEVDLSNYATKGELDGKVDKQTGYSLVSNEEITKLGTVSANAQPNFVKSVGSEFAVDNNGNLTLEAIPEDLDLSGNNTIEQINTGLSTKVTAKTGYDLVSQEQIEKLAALPADAEKNYISDVTAELKVEDGTLSIVSVAATKLSDLASNQEFADVVSDIQTINSNLDDIDDSIVAIQSSITAHGTRITTLETNYSALKDRVDAHDLTIADLVDALTWKDLSDLVQ